MKVSRQRRYQLRMKAKGCCVVCGEPAGEKPECVTCLDKRATRQARVKPDQAKINARARDKRARARKSRNGQNRCGACGKLGHNRRRCVHVMVYV